VDLIGIEPMTSSMPWKRAPSCATGPHAARDATLLLSPLGSDSSNPKAEQELPIRSIPGGKWILSRVPRWKRIIPVTLGAQMAFVK
jgi:hypothetical protein